MINHLFAVILVLILYAIPATSQIELVNGIEFQYEMNLFGQPTSYNTVRVIGDTLINDQECKILEREFTNCNQRPKRDFIYQQKNHIYYYHFEDSIFRQLYDFRAEVGEIMELRAWKTYEQNHEFVYIRVDSIKTVFIGETPVKKFHVRYGIKNGGGLIVFNNFITEIIEGIGSIYNFFHFVDYGFCEGKKVTPLICYYHPIHGSFSTNQDCSLTSNTFSNKYAVEDLFAFPNPFLNEVQIEIPETCSNFTLQFYNSQGLLIYMKEYRNFTNQKIHLSPSNSIPQGIYFLNIRDLENSRTYTQKLIKS